MPNAQPITLQRRIVFLHIAKTAGTSIVQFFRRRLPAESICSHGDFLGFPPGEAGFAQAMRQYQFVSGHFGYRDVAPLLDESYAFTFLRDPIERVLSLYKFCMHADMQRQFAVARAARDLGLEGFLTSGLPEVVEMLDNQQTWQLARSYWQQDREALAELQAGDLLALAKSHLTRFARVGLTETFDADFARILADLEIGEAVPAARHFKTPDPLSSAALSPATLASLRQRQALDYALLEHVRAARRAADNELADDGLSP